MDHHQALAFRLVEMIMAIEIRVVSKASVQALCMRSINSKGSPVYFRT